MWLDFVKKKALEASDQPAIMDRITGKRWCYVDLEEEIMRWARHFFRLGLSRGDRVAYLAPNRMEHLTLFFACAKLGIIFVPLNYRLAPGELANILPIIDPEYFLGEGPCPFVSEYTYWRVADIVLDPQAVDPPEMQIADDDPLLMLYTSGSTGTPKGVLFHAGMLMANMQHTIDSGVLEVGDISIINTPFFHTGAYNVFCLPLLALGGTLILFEGFDPGGVLKAIREDQVNIFWAVPTMFQAIREHPDFDRTDFSRIRCLLSGGAPLNLPLIQAYHQRGVPFKQGFGLTEVGPNCFLLDTADCYDRPDSIGKPMGRSQTRVVDDNNQDVGPNQVGELLLAGPHLCKGYWREPALFESALVDGRFFKTGDLVRVDESGFFFVVGRKKDMYISGGENVYPGEVEKQLVAHESITQAVVVAVPDEKWTEVGFAFLVGAGGVSLVELRSWLNARLARYKHPHYCAWIASLPLLANGKIDRRALQKAALDRISTREMHEG